MPPRLLILETSHRRGHVALADGETVLAERPLDEARRHARDLAPLTRELLAERGWKARDLDGVIVSLGPGSYTGLRVGIMSAKALAYATGCALLAVDTFAALALQVPADAQAFDVIADAQQDKLYVQRFTTAGAGPLAIQALADWLPSLSAMTWVTGPGLERFAKELPADVPRTAADAWTVRPSSLLRIGLARLQRGERDDPFRVEPIYLRPSSAEENWRKKPDAVC